MRDIEEVVRYLKIRMELDIEDYAFERELFDGKWDLVKMAYARLSSSYSILNYVMGQEDVEILGRTEEECI